MTTALYILSGILLVYLGYLIGIIHASIVALKEREVDKKNIEQLQELTAKLVLQLTDKGDENDKS